MEQQQLIDRQREAQPEVISCFCLKLLRERESRWSVRLSHTSVNWAVVQFILDLQRQICHRPHPQWWCSIESVVLMQVFNMFKFLDRPIISYHNAFILLLIFKASACLASSCVTELWTPPAARHCLRSASKVFFSVSASHLQTHTLDIKTPNQTKRGEKSRN